MNYVAATDDYQPFSQSKIELFWHQGTYVTSDMFTILAITSFVAAPADCVGALVNYWRHLDAEKAAEEKRPKRIIPYYNNAAAVKEVLQRLVENGLVVKYTFYPKAPITGKEDLKEDIYFATGGATRLAKKQLLDVDTGLVDPMDNCGQPDDAFSACLMAKGMAPFLSESTVKKVTFKRVETGMKAGENGKDKEKGRFTIRGMIRFNPNGRKGNFEEDTDVLFEGVTFETNQNVRTLSDKENAIRKKVKILAQFVDRHSAEYPTYVVFVCEDGAGITKLSRIIDEECPELFDRALFTSGTVLRTSHVMEAPDNLKDCFVAFERNDDGKIVGVGAYGYSFIENCNGQGFGSSL